MTEIINFKNSPYFLFKQHLEASWGGIGIHTKESFGQHEKGKQHSFNMITWNNEII